jgi:hypothetical protein
MEDREGIQVMVLVVTIRDQRMGVWETLAILPQLLLTIFRMQLLMQIVERVVVSVMAKGGRIKAQVAVGVSAATHLYSCKKIKLS